MFGVGFFEVFDKQNTFEFLVYYSGMMEFCDQVCRILMKLKKVSL